MGHVKSTRGTSKSTGAAESRRGSAGETSISPDTRRRRRLLGGVSAASLVAATALALPAAATDINGTQAKVVGAVIGDAGRDAERQRSGPTISATNGGTGPKQDFRLLGTAGDAQSPGNYVFILSSGGRGGDAIQDFGAADGGIGGNVSFEQSGIILVPARGMDIPTPLIWLQSIGGTGGAGSPLPGAWAGTGGAGGVASAKILNTTGTQGDNYAVVRVTSQGGLGGSEDVILTQTNFGDKRQLGGAGGAASLEIGPKAIVFTTGNSAPAVIVEALGGAGGASRFGRGGSGGNSGATPSTKSVEFINEGTIETIGNTSPAVILQSVGGNGADGGTLAVTGFAGGGGGAGAGVVGTNTGEISTNGDYSFGVIAQSVGGSGGKGASGVFVGGNGGSAGRGGDVSVTNYGVMQTEGEGASAIVGQSIGGGNALAALPTRGAPSSGGGRGGAAFLGVGGGGGSGGDAGAVTISNPGDIETFGNSAQGILAQSIGGGGGNGGSVRTASLFAAVAIGGDGGSGGNGGSVEVVSRGDGSDSQISTWGDSSNAILAQSVGGSGGIGGSAWASSAGYAGSLAVTIGGSGGPGGNGGTVNIDNTSTLFTAGESSAGIQAMSIGGGGGSGGKASSYSFALSDAYPAVSLAVSVGGSGGGGGAGGAVTVSNFANIHTNGSGAFGIDAMSVGGGGGDAGEALSYALAASATAFSLSVPISYGGSGGGGGAGGSVSVANSAEIITSGAGSTGISAVSIGGGGGKAVGGTSTANMLGLVRNLGVTASYGGRGGGGGGGGDVGVVNDGSIWTLGEFAQGISAVSIGGGGGVGGGVDTSAAAEFTLDAGGGTYGKSIVKAVSGIVEALGLADSITVSASLGGSGGDGGNGGNIKVANTGLVRTGGSNSVAVSAISIGGGGGVGGGFQGGGEGDAAGNLSVGGTGGKGGNGGNVAVTNAAGASIQTDEAGSAGIFAQSIGGGGGVGGAFTGKRKPAPTINPDADGLIAKGYLSVSVAIANELMKLNKAGTRFLPETAAFDKNSLNQQRLTNLKGFLKAAKIAVDKDKSVEERVIGGAFFSALAAAQIRYKDKIKKFSDGLKNGVADTKVFSISAQVALGGSGGGGGAGGVVNVENAGSISTAGETSYAVFAQSVGGGGGAAGGAYATGNSLLNVNLSVGGSGGKGGDGGEVHVKNSSSLATFGAGSFGIFAQSVGGGGGVSGGSANASGMSLLNFNANVGGGGGASGNGGRVDVVNSGAIHTEGVEAHAIVAQSVGGGGGVFFVNPGDPNDAGTKLSPDEAEVVQLTFDLLKSLKITQGGEASFDNTTTVLPKPAFNVSMGGDGTGGGSGGEVSVANNGAIWTSGKASFGIFAQAIGGGGGLGGSAGGSGWLQINSSFGGKGGTAGDGGRIDVTLGNGSSVTTSGNGSTAIFLQSIGGGGGYAGAATSTKKSDVTIGGSSGNGGRIALAMDSADSRMRIETTGASAHGIFAQSLGGGGGTMARTDGSTQLVSSTQKGRAGAIGQGGAIDINVAGVILATGDGSNGIFVQSGVQKADGTLDPERLADAIKVTYSGILTGGSGGGAAILVEGGNRGNSITIGAGSTVQALSGNAILSSFGGNFVTNRGTIIGNVDLTREGRSDENQFYNFNGATYQSAGTIKLGARGLFVNEGILNIGGRGIVGTTELTGNIDIQKNGTLLVDISPQPGAKLKNDMLKVSGQAKLYEGTLKPNVVNWLQKDTYTVLTAEGGITGRLTVSGEHNVAVPINWTLATNEKQLSISPQVDFRTPAGVTLSEDQVAVARTIQRYWDASTPRYVSLFPQLLSIQTGAAYAKALDDFTPEENQEILFSQIQNAQASLKAALSCPAFTGAETLVQEGECVWARVEAGQSIMTSSAAQSGYSMNTLTYRIGGQKEIAPDWFLGFSAGYTDGSAYDSGGASNSQLSTIEGSLALKRQIGPWLFAVSGTVGNTWTDTARYSSVGALNSVLESNANTFFAGARVRGSYEFAMRDWYIKPYVDVDAFYFNFGSYSETGSSPLALNVNGSDQMLFSVSPRVEVGGRVNLENGYWLRPYGMVGLTWLSESEFTTTASLQGMPSWVPGFESSSIIPDKLLNIGLGAQYSAGKGVELTMEYNADVANNFLNHTGSAKLSVRF